MANDIGNVRSVNAESIALNNASGQASKPPLSGSSTGGGSKPPRDLGMSSTSVPMPK